MHAEYTFKIEVQAHGTETLITEQKTLIVGCTSSMVMRNSPDWKDIKNLSLMAPITNVFEF